MSAGLFKTPCGLARSWEESLLLPGGGGGGGGKSHRVTWQLFPDLWELVGG